MKKESHFRVLLPGLRLPLMFAFFVWAGCLAAISGGDELAETWDATTLDAKGELRSLAGTWQHVPWESLTSVPDFKDAQPVAVPPSQGQGAYRTSFTLEEALGARRAILRFGAVAFRCAVLVNGREVGGHAGGMTPFELDITDAVRAGANELVVLVLGAKGRALSAEAADATKITYNERGQALTSGGDKTVLGGGMFPVDGIPQGVWLRLVAPLRVADATLVSSFRKRELSAEITINNQTAKDQSVAVSLDVLPYDIPSHQVGDTPVWSEIVKTVAAPGLSAAKITRPWPDARLWMPGDAHLYVARIRVIGSHQSILSERLVRFGFREVWLEGNKIIVNGLPFRAFVHGDLAAEATPEETRATFRAVMAAGINMVRPHTRPPVPTYVQVADEMGVAIIAESELAFNSNFAYEEPVFWANYERLIRERIARDKNHPSILIWSLANEVIICSPGAEIGKHFYEAFLRLREVDPTRPFMQEGDGDLRDMREGAKGFPIDIINLHLYDVSPFKNPLWATEFPPVAWALETVKTPKEMPATNKFGSELPDQKRPWFVGEFGLAVSAAYPDFFSFWTGPDAYRDLFGDAPELIRAVGEVTVMQLQAFRDMDMAGMDPWDTPDKTALVPYLQRGLEPVTTFTRDQSAHWTGGERAAREVIVMNDSFATQELTLTLTLKQGETEVNRTRQMLTLAPGEKQVRKWEYTLPEVAGRTAYEFGVKLTAADGREVSGFSQSWQVFPKMDPGEAWRDGRVWLVGDPAKLGAIAQWAGVPVRPTAEVDKTGLAGVDLVIWDGGALEAGAQSKVDRFVEDGGTLVALGAGRSVIDAKALVPNPESDSTRLFLLRASPLTAGTEAGDWEFWRPGHYMSRGNIPMNFDPALDVPLVGGGRNGPMYSPLIVAKKGAGRLVDCRLVLNEAVAEEPVARVWLNNLAVYAAGAAEQRKAARGGEPALIFLGAEGERESWAARVKVASIAMVPVGENLAEPGGRVAWLPGSANLRADERKRIADFVEGGGTLWVHRLTPETPYLGWLEGRIGQKLAMRAPTMWLQQLETVRGGAEAPAVLNGINDFFTCWATFGWTNGDMRTVRTTRIVDYVLTDVGEAGEVLLREPRWTGQWDVTPNGYTLSQAILREVGHHERNANPGAGLVVFPVGRGRVVIDQMRWDEVMGEAKSESQSKARYLGGTLWRNMAASAPLLQVTSEK